MRITLITCGIVAAIIGVRLIAGPPKTASPELLQLRHLERYVKVTERPFEMHDSTVTACRAPIVPDVIPTNPHDPSDRETAFCNVYVNAMAKDVILSGKGTYPVGSLVIKSKLASADDPTPHLFTVMQKMATGYDSKRGDWKYTVIDGIAYREMASGRIDSCIECHEQYKETDYVTREYLQDTGLTKR
jgi:hypothetical protein